MTAPAFIERTADGRADGADLAGNVADTSLTAAPVEVSSDITGDQWDAFVETCPKATAYHLWGWRTVFERAFGHRTSYLVARRADRIVGVLPLVMFDSWLFGRFGVSLPFVNGGGVLAEDPAVAAALLDHAIGVAQQNRARHLELRHVERHYPSLPAKHHKVAMTLKLAADEKTAWARLDSKVRNQVRKGEKSGLTFVAGGSELLPEFYDVFAANMRDLGTPVYAPRFFEQVLAAFPSRTRVLVVRHGTSAVAAAISFAWKDSVEVPWASSLRAARAMCPNMFLYWHLIREAIAGGYAVFDFGRSTPGGGTFQFKRQWGAEPTELAWEYWLAPGTTLPDQSPNNPKFGRAIAAWQRLPVWMTKAVGPAIVRNIP